MNEEAEGTSFQSSIEKGCATYRAMSAGEEMVASSEVVEGNNRKRVHRSWRRRSIAHDLRKVDQMVQMRSGEARS
jgi:hypothetical protein